MGSVDEKWAAKYVRNAQKCFCGYWLSVGPRRKSEGQEPFQKGLAPAENNPRDWDQLTWAAGSSGET